MMAQGKYTVSDTRIHRVLRQGIHSTTELSQRFGMSASGMLQRLRKCPGIEVTAKMVDGGARGAASVNYWGLVDRHAPTLTRQERLEGLADRGCDTWEEYRGER